MTDQVEQNKTELAVELAIEVNKLFKLKTPDGLISETGMRNLQVYMYDQGLGDLPSDFEAVWTGKRGTLPKRVTSHVYKTHQIKLSPEQVSTIGNLVRPHASIAREYICDFTRSFDWSSGDFGDSGSCFWGSNCGAKAMLEENGAYAFRLYNWTHSEAQRLAVPLHGELNYVNVKGYARAWVVKLLDSNKLIVFNGYPSGALELARLLALKFNCSYKKLNLTNRGAQGGLLYINSGSYVVGQWSKIAEMASFDLDYDDIEQDEEEVAANCYNCDCDIASEDDIAHSLNRNGESVACCSDCSSYCERCEENYVASLVRELDGEYYCRDCREAVLLEREEAEAEEARQEEKAREEAELDRQQEALATRLEQEEASVTVESEGN